MRVVYLPIYLSARSQIAGRAFPAVGMFVMVVSLPICLPTCSQIAG